jgi:hypothetical protein
MKKRKYRRSAGCGEESSHLTYTGDYAAKIHAGCADVAACSAKENALQRYFFAEAMLIAAKLSTGGNGFIHSSPANVSNSRS